MATINIILYNNYQLKHVEKKMKFMGIHIYTKYFTDILSTMKQNLFNVEYFLSKFQILLSQMVIDNVTHLLLETHFYWEINLFSTSCASLIHSSYKSMLSSYHVPESFLDTEGIVLSQTDNKIVLMDIIFQWKQDQLVKKVINVVF